MNPDNPNPQKQPENQPNGAQETLREAEQALHEATQSPPYTDSGNISNDDKTSPCSRICSPSFSALSRRWLFG